MNKKIPKKLAITLIIFGLLGIAAFFFAPILSTSMFKLLMGNNIKDMGSLFFGDAVIGTIIAYAWLAFYLSFVLEIVFCIILLACKNKKGARVIFKLFEVLLILLSLGTCAGIGVLIYAVVCSPTFTFQLLLDYFFDTNSLFFIVTLVLGLLTAILRLVACVLTRVKNVATLAKVQIAPVSQSPNPPPAQQQAPTMQQPYVQQQQPYVQQQQPYVQQQQPYVQQQPYAQQQPYQQQNTAHSNNEPVYPNFQPEAPITQRNNIGQSNQQPPIAPARPVPPPPPPKGD